MSHVPCIMRHGYVCFFLSVCGCCQICAQYLEHNIWPNNRDKRKERKEHRAATLLKTVDCQSWSPLLWRTMGKDEGWDPLDAGAEDEGPLEASGKAEGWDHLDAGRGRRRNPPGAWQGHWRMITEGQLSAWEPMEGHWRRMAWEPCKGWGRAEAWTRAGSWAGAEAWAGALAAIGELRPFNSSTKGTFKPLHFGG